MNNDVKKYYEIEPPANLPFRIAKLGHAVLIVEDIDRSVDFYTQILGFRVSDAYPEDMVPGKMVFLRFNSDHHGVALIGSAKGQAVNRELHHMAFEVATLDEVFQVRAHLKEHNVPIDFEGRRRAGCQVAVEFRDPDRHRLEIYWGLDQIDDAARARPASQWNWCHSLEEAIDNPPPGQNPVLQDPSLRE